MIDYEFKFFCNMHQKQPLFLTYKLFRGIITYVRKVNFFVWRVNCLNYFINYAVKFILEHIGKVSRNSYLMIYWLENDSHILCKDFFSFTFF